MRGLRLFNFVKKQNKHIKLVVANIYKPDRYAWTGMPVRYTWTCGWQNFQFFLACSGDLKKWAISFDIYQCLNERRRHTGPCGVAIRQPAQLFCICYSDKVYISLRPWQPLTREIVILSVWRHLLRFMKMKNVCGK